MILLTHFRECDKTMILISLLLMFSKDNYGIYIKQGNIYFILLLYIWGEGQIDMSILTEYTSVYAWYSYTGVF